MERLNDEFLIKTYYRALELNLDKDFLTLLLKEIKRRGGGRTEIYNGHV